jgi:hydroxyethylthiazole kinase
VLDPVGAGATAYRTDTVHRLCDEAAPTIVRGNASEIRAIAGQGHQTKGVDSADPTEAAEDAASAFARAIGCVVTVSGAVDFVVDGGHAVRVANGHPLMPRVTGLGCTATAIIAACAAVNPDPFAAAAHGMVIMGVAGEMAGEGASGPASFLVRFIDALGSIGEADIAARMRLA